MHIYIYKYYIQCFMCRFHFACVVVGSCCGFTVKRDKSDKYVCFPEGSQIGSVSSRVQTKNNFVEIHLNTRGCLIGELQLIQLLHTVINQDLQFNRNLQSFVTFLLIEGIYDSMIDRGLLARIIQPGSFVWSLMSFPQKHHKQTADRQGSAIRYLPCPTFIFRPTQTPNKCVSER